MADPSKSVSPIAKADDRRLFARQEVRDGSLEFGTTGSATLIDVGEAGIAVQSSLPFNEHDFLTVRFRLSESEPWIEAKARLAWLSKSQKQAGVEFVELSDVARAQIRLWMEKATAGETTTEVSASGKRAALSYPAAETAAAAPWERWQSIVRARIWPFLRERPLTAAMALSVFILLFVAASRLRAPQGQGLQARLASSAARASGAPYSNGSAPPLPSSGAIVGSALTLQVAAMRSRENAESLVTTLQRNNFSVFISQPAGAHLFFVMVGPFQSQAALDAARQELKQEGFDTIVRQQSSP